MQKCSDCCWYQEKNDKAGYCCAELPVWCEQEGPLVDNDREISIDDPDHDSYCGCYNYVEGLRARSEMTDKIKNEIQKEIDSFNDSLNSYVRGCVSGMETALEIIKKHGG